MQHGLESALGHFFFQHAGRVFFGLAGVDDQRQTRFTGRRNVIAEPLHLRLARAEVVVIIQPRLANANDLWMSAQAHNFSHR